MGRWITEDIEIFECVGRGGMGEVRRAFQDLPDNPKPKLVAVKFINGISPAKSALEKFHQEGRILSSLKHPNVVSFFETRISDEGQPFIVTEYIDGKSLRDILDSEPSHRLDPLVAVQIAQQIASVIEYTASISEGLGISTRYLVHGDLSPGNVMIDNRGSVKVIDFGAARLIDPSITNTLTEGAGTLDYSAPETIKGRVSINTETFSLGCILYEMLTGRKAIRGKTISAKVESIKNVHSPKRIQFRTKVMRGLNLDNDTIETVLGLMGPSYRVRTDSRKKLQCSSLASTDSEFSKFNESPKVHSNETGNESVSPLKLALPIFGSTVKRSSLVACAAFGFLGFVWAPSYLEPQVSSREPQAFHQVELEYPLSESLTGYFEDLENRLYEVPDSSKPPRNPEYGGGIVDNPFAKPSPIGQTPPKGQKVGGPLKDPTGPILSGAKKNENDGEKAIPDGPLAPPSNGEEYASVDPLLLSSVKLAGSYAEIDKKNGGNISIDWSGIIQSELCGRPWMKIVSLNSYEACPKNVRNCGSFAAKILSKNGVSPDCQAKFNELICSFDSAQGGIEWNCTALTKSGVRTSLTTTYKFKRTEFGYEGF